MKGLKHFLIFRSGEAAQATRIGRKDSFNRPLND